MTTFEIFDLTCDSVNPVLMSLAIILTIKKSAKEGFKIGLINISYLLLSIIFVYIISAIDYKLNLWSSASLDYSTHTALALSCTLYLITMSNRLFIWLIILLIYFILMLHQGYHSIMDIITTTIVLSLVLFFIYRILNKLKTLI